MTASTAQLDAVQKIANLRTTELAYVAMSDTDLVEATYKLVGVLEDELGDRLYWHIGELLERFAPDLERASTEAQYAEDDNRENEIAACFASIDRRAEAREVFRGARRRQHLTEWAERRFSRVTSAAGNGQTPPNDGGRS